MLLSDLLNTDFGPEYAFNTSRSGGAGGQNVNKVETKVELRFKIGASCILDDFQKEKIRIKFKNQINTEDELIVTSQESRSQLKNKATAILKFKEILQKALEEKPPRKPTKIPLEKIEKRLKSKKNMAEKKLNRSKVVVYKMPE